MLNLLNTSDMSKSSNQINNYKSLPTHFQGRGEVKGYTFTQISKTDKAFIYEVSSGNSKHYEVFLKKINTLYKCESYPTSKAFGLWAWTKMTLEAANQKFEELNSCD